MRRIIKPKTSNERRLKRHMRIRNKVAGTTERPRLVVFRSLKHIYAQLVDDVTGKTLLTATEQPADFHSVGRDGKRHPRAARHRRRPACACRRR